MTKLLCCTLGAALGLLASATAADPPATPAMPVPPAVPAPIPAAGPGLPSSAPNPIAMPANMAHPGELPTGPPVAHAAGGSLLDLWLTYYDVPPRHEFSTDVLIWWVKGATTPNLLQVVPPSRTGLRPNGGIIIGLGDLDEQQRYGVRLAYTHWFDRDCTRGAELSAFTMGDRHAFVGFSSNEFPDLSRPFIADNTDLPGFGPITGRPVFIAGAVTGLFSSELDSEFYAQQINFRRRVAETCNARIDGLAGFRYLNLNERLTLTEDTFRFADNPAFEDEFFGTKGQVFDRFSTNNDFFGGQIGANYEYRWGTNCAFDLRTMVAFGSTHQRISVEGTTARLFVDGTTERVMGGFLAQESNIGTRTQNKFTFVPQITAQFSYYATPGLRLFGGYDFLYSSQMSRVNEQIDLTIDALSIPRFIPEGVNVLPAGTTPRPAPLFQTNDFWAQGVSFGFEYKW